MATRPGEWRAHTMSDAPTVLLIAVFVMAGLVVFMAALMLIDRKQYRSWINDLHLKILSRDVPEYVTAQQGLKADPELLAKLEEIAEEQEYANYQDRIPVG